MMKIHRIRRHGADDRPVIAGGTPVFDVGTLSSSQKSANFVQDDFRQGVMALKRWRSATAGRSGLYDGRAAERELGAPTRRRILEEIEKHPNLRLLLVVGSDNDASDRVTKFSNAARPTQNWIFLRDRFVFAAAAIDTRGVSQSGFVAGGLRRWPSKHLRTAAPGNAARLSIWSATSRSGSSSRSSTASLIAHSTAHPTAPCSRPMRVIRLGSKAISSGRRRAGKIPSSTPSLAVDVAWRRRLHLRQSTSSHTRVHDRTGKSHDARVAAERHHQALSWRDGARQRRP